MQLFIILTVVWSSRRSTSQQYGYRKTLSDSIESDVLVVSTAVTITPPDTTIQHNGTLRKRSKEDSLQEGEGCLGRNDFQAQEGGRKEEEEGQHTLSHPKLEECGAICAVGCHAVRYLCSTREAYANSG